MSEETPGQEIAVRQNTAPALINPTTDSWTAVVRDVALLSDHIAGSEFVPKGLRDSPAKVAAAILHGRELGLPPMTALAGTHIVEGRPAITAETMRALVFQAGHKIIVTETSGAHCVVKGQRAGDTEWITVEWTIAMAQAAGLAGKTNWKNYPRQMLQARATTELCRLLFPDVIHGLRSFEELQDMAGEVEAGPATEATPSAPQESGRVQRSRKSARKAPSSQPRQEETTPAPSGREAVGIPERGKPEPEASPEQQAATDAERERQQAELAKLAEQHREDKANGVATPLGTVEQRASEQAEADLEREAAGDNAEDIQDAEIVDDAPKISASQRASLMGHFNRLDASDRTERLAITAYFAGRDSLATTNDLTVTEAAKVLQALERLRDRDALDQALTTDSLLGD